MLYNCEGFLPGPAQPSRVPPHLYSVRKRLYGKRPMRIGLARSEPEGCPGLRLMTVASFFFFFLFLSFCPRCPKEHWTRAHG